MTDRPEDERHPNGVGSMGTLRLSSLQRILGLSFETLTVGGMTECSKIRHAFTNDAKNAATSI
jgi:hypothetical protein